jgi:hypothetical protein
LTGFLKTKKTLFSPQRAEWGCHGLFIRCPWMVKSLGIIYIIFFKCWPSQGEHLFDHFLWPIFQSWVTHVTNYKSLYDIDHLWTAFVYCINTCLSDLWVLIFIVGCTSACGTLNPI